jgi:hypothetical protein
MSSPGLTAHAATAMAKRDNGAHLREVIKRSGLTQVEALIRYNRGQVRPLALRTLKAYLAGETSKSRVVCGDAVVERFRKVLPER